MNNNDIKMMFNYLRLLEDNANKYVLIGEDIDIDLTGKIFENNM